MKINKLKNKLKKILFYFKEINLLSTKINLQIENSNAILKKLINDKPVNKIKVGFLVHNIDAWYSIGEVINKMINDNYFEVFVFSINKKFPGEKKCTGEEKVHNFLKTQNIPHIRLNIQDSFSALNIIKRFEPNILFRQSQWDNDYPPGFSTLHLNFTNLAYISYELLNHTVNVPLSEDVLDSGVDSYFHRQCWKVFCANELVKEQASKNGRILGRQFVITGHPKIDFHLNNSVKFWPLNTSNKIKILWTAHHSILKGWNDFGMFHLIYNEMLAWAKESHHIDFVLSPHPALLTILNSNKSPISIKSFSYFLNQWESLTNCSLYTQESYANLLNSCDYIVTDSPSMTIEGQLYKKPIFFLDRSDRIQFNKIGRILESGIHKVKSVDELKEIFSSNSIEHLQLKNQLDNIEKLFSYKNAVNNIIEHIKSEYKNN